MEKHIDGTENKPAEKGTKAACDPNEMATRRTVMAASRTLMAWERTGISQISFGFTIYKVLQTFQQEGKIKGAHKLLSPDIVGGALCILGIIAIIFGVIDYRRTCKMYGARIERLATTMALLIAFLGFGLLLAIFFRV